MMATARVTPRDRPSRRTGIVPVVQSMNSVHYNPNS